MEFGIYIMSSKVGWSSGVYSRNLIKSKMKLLTVNNKIITDWFSHSG